MNTKFKLNIENLEAFKLEEENVSCHSVIGGHDLMNPVAQTVVPDGTCNAQTAGDEGACDTDDGSKDDGPWVSGDGLGN